MLKTSKASIVSLNPGGIMQITKQDLGADLPGDRRSCLFQ